MPTDCMPDMPRGERFDGGKPATAAEVKSGFLVFLGPGGMRQDVRLIVYRTSLEHFCVIYPRKRVTKPIGVVNLRNTSVEQVDASSGFVIRQKGYDDTVTARFMCSQRDVAAWLSAFAPRAAPRALPVLLESDTEDS